MKNLDLKSSLSCKIYIHTQIEFISIKLYIIRLDFMKGISERILCSSINLDHLLVILIRVLDMSRRHKKWPPSLEIVQPKVLTFGHQKSTKKQNKKGCFCHYTIGISPGMSTNGLRRDLVLINAPLLHTWPCAYTLYIPIL